MALKTMSVCVCGGGGIFSYIRKCFAQEKKKK